MLPFAAIEPLYNPNVGTTPVEEGRPHQRPRKPLMIKAALGLVDEGRATPERIAWRLELRDRFTARFLLVRKHITTKISICPSVIWQATASGWSTRVTIQLPIGDIGLVFARFTSAVKN